MSDQERNRRFEKLTKREAIQTLCRSSVHCHPPKVIRSFRLTAARRFVDPGSSSCESCSPREVCGGGFVDSWVAGRRKHAADRRAVARVGVGIEDEIGHPGARCER